MQDVVTVSVTVGNLRVQRFSRYFSAFKSPFRLRAILAQAWQKLATIYGAALLSAAAFCATTIGIHAQVNAQRGAQIESQNNTIKREIKAAAGRDVRVGFYTSIRPIAVQVAAVNSVDGCSRARHRHCQARDPQSDQFEAMFGGRGAGFCSILSRRAGF
jgi:hypothetical protein